MTDFSREATIHHSFASRQHSAETVFVGTCVCPPVCNTAGGDFFPLWKEHFPLSSCLAYPCFCCSENASCSYGEPGLVYCLFTLLKILDITHAIVLSDSRLKLKSHAILPPDTPQKTRTLSPTSDHVETRKNSLCLIQHVQPFYLPGDSMEEHRYIRT